MASLSRTKSMESAVSNLRSGPGSLNGDMQDRSTGASGPPSPTTTKPPRSLASTGRVPSHSLLSAPHNAAVPSRKSRFADAGTSGGNIGRASISMPPPATKPSSIYRPANVRRPTGAQSSMDSKDGRSSLDGSIEDKSFGDTAVLDDLEKSTSSQSVPASEPHSPSGISDSGLKPPGSAFNKSGDRLSFSSLYSLGSAIYNGTTGVTSPPQSTASSTAGSVKSFEHPTPIGTTLISPALGPTKGEAASSATTATAPISVVANSQTDHQGSTTIWICS